MLRTKQNEKWRMKASRIKVIMIAICTPYRPNRRQFIGNLEMKIYFGWVRGEWSTHVEWIHVIDTHGESVTPKNVLRSQLRKIAINKRMLKEKNSYFRRMEPSVMVTTYRNSLDWWLTWLSVFSIVHLVCKFAFHLDSNSMSHWRMDSSPMAVAWRKQACST